VELSRRKQRQRFAGSRDELLNFIRDQVDRPPERGIHCGSGVSHRTAIDLAFPARPPRTNSKRLRGVTGGRESLNGDSIETTVFPQV